MSTFSVSGPKILSHIMLRSADDDTVAWTLMGDFVVQECGVHGTDLESHGPTSILCDDPLPLLTSVIVSCKYDI